MLREVAPEPADAGSEALGALLWREVRHLHTWAVTRSEFRADGRARIESGEKREMRELAKIAAPELTNALSNFADAAAPEAVIAACREIVQWAEGRLWTETAMQYAEAAAMLDPDDAELANLAGRVCRRGGQRARAEVWYDRAIGLSRASRNVREYISAHLGFAAVLRDRERYEEALHYIKRAGLTAKRAGIRKQAGEAFHDAVGIATLRGDFPRAAVYARRALAVYPRHHARFPAFGYDLAFLMVDLGMYSHALSLLNSVAPKISSPAERVVVLGTLARAAAGAGLRARYIEVAQTVQEQAPHYPVMAAGALYSVAEGARLLGDWDDAARLAELAVASGRANDQPLALGRAQKLLSEVAARQPGPAPLSREDARGAILRNLAPVVRLRLRAWRGPTWRPRRQV